jgi:catechol O-methyltransferase
LNADKLKQPVPETHHVASRSAVLDVLNEANQGKKKYIMKTLELDDAAQTNAGIVLPKRTLSQTYSHVSKLSISKSTPWVLQRVIKGEKYCTHSIVVDGQVKLFVACPCPDFPMHYQAMAPESGLSRAMLRFTEQFAAKAGLGLTGHLSFDFMVDEKITISGVEKSIYPVECVPQAHPAAVLFSGIEASIDMVTAYMRALDSPHLNGTDSSNDQHAADTDDRSVAYPRSTAAGSYWIGHDIVTLVMLPLLRLFTFNLGIWQVLQHVTTFVTHLLYWRDATYEVWDPLPSWWLYHVYWPGLFLASVRTGKKWSWIDVSTSKIYEC